MLRITLLALILANLLPNITFAQSAPRATVNQGIEWFAVSSNVKVHKHLSFLFDTQIRFAGPFQPMQMQYRTAVEIPINKSWSIAPLGYVYTTNPLYGKQPNTFVNNEHRLWSQVQYKHIAGRFNFAHRARYERRFVQVHTNTNGEIVDQGYDFFANRFRYRLLLNVPLNKPKMEAGAFFASVYSETFVSWGGKVTYNKPDQTRVFVGAGFQASHKLTIASGFIYQMLIKANGTKQENNFGVQTYLIYNFDLTK